MELLFESRSEIVARRGRLIPFQNTASISDAPVLSGDTDADGCCAATYGTVLHDQGRYRMWYQAAPRSHAFDSDIADVGYAESDDGWEWRKPDLGRPGLANICDLGLHAPSIMKIGDGYLATGCSKRARGIREELPGTAYYIARSSDGIHWQAGADAPCLPGADVITGIWDPRRNRGEAACKYLRFHGGSVRRALFRAHFDATSWETPTLAIMPNEADDYAAIARGCRSADYYGMTLMPCGAEGMLGLVWMFYHLPPFSKSGSGIFGGGALVPAYRETPESAWVFGYGRTPFIEHPAGFSRQPFFYAASTPLDCGDEQRLYCTAFRHGHGSALNEERKRQPEGIERMRADGLAGIHLARWPRDRIFGFRAETDADLILIPKVPAGPFKLRLNFRTVSSGWIRVCVCHSKPGIFVPGFSAIPEDALNGYDFTVCTTLEGDHFAKTVCWQAGETIQQAPAGQTVIIKIRMFMAECFAYEILPA